MRSGNIHAHGCVISGNCAQYLSSWHCPHITLSDWTSRTARTLASRIPPEQWSVHNHSQGSSVHMTNLILLLFELLTGKSLFRHDLNHINPLLSTVCQTCSLNRVPGFLIVWMAVGWSPRGARPRIPSPATTAKFYKPQRVTGDLLFDGRIKEK